ncbi:Protein of unknown function [Pyronema omphalodes CBS 100304]|uniref:Uncharacterized protein n=1 Tax=Pyronema omphalodes (strain CBS 100304) TaxID=1076935 RepID=U4LUV8_PYROM|nr:Protein of unknown function [Pyronema omphalodes CBS 100304]
MNCFRVKFRSPQSQQMSNLYPALSVSSLISHRTQRQVLPVFGRGYKCVNIELIKHVQKLASPLHRPVVIAPSSHPRRLHARPALPASVARSRLASLREPLRRRHTVVCFVWKTRLNVHDWHFYDALHSSPIILPTGFLHKRNA